MKILITGGAGFVGSNLALKLKEKNSQYSIVCLDNLKRRGSELNLPRLKGADIEFVHGDIRNKEDLMQIHDIDLILECSAEPSVLAGIDGSPEYLIQTNLMGTVNCLELARRDKSGFIFLSTSRVYPIKVINSLNYSEAETRFELSDEQNVPGASREGFTEDLTLKGARSLYGATKLASELLIEEYRDVYGIETLINRCGVITGPWQMGKVDQGVVVHWIASHLFNKSLKYFGYGGKGKQVRDILHIDDLFRLIDIQVNRLSDLNGNLYNVGGGRDVSISLQELTALCQKHTGNEVEIGSVVDDRAADIRIYLTDNGLVNTDTGWVPQKSADDIVRDITGWMLSHRDQLSSILG